MYTSCLVRGQMEGTACANIWHIGTANGDNILDVAQFIVQNFCALSTLHRRQLLHHNYNANMVASNINSSYPMYSTKRLRKSLTTIQANLQLSDDSNSF